MAEMTTAEYVRFNDDSLYREQLIEQIRKIGINKNNAILNMKYSDSIIRKYCKILLKDKHV